MGICLPSPVDWNLTPLASLLLNVGLLGVCALVLLLLSKSFSVIKGKGGILALLFLVTSVSFPWASGGLLTTSLILALGMLLCLGILFSAYRKSNAARQLFLMATILALGSMVQYSFLIMSIPLLIVAVTFKSLRMREVIAFGMGLCAPYWIVLGLMLIPVDSLRLPEPMTLWNGMPSHTAIFTGLANLGFTAVVSLILGLNNGMKLYAGNTRRRMFNMAVDIVQAAALIAMILDFNNMTAYVVTFFMGAAFQYTNIFSLWNLRRPWIWLTGICAVYVTFLILAYMYL
jgi:hypothetical protein